MTCCAVRNIFVFATDEPQDLEHIIEQSLARDLTPLLVIDPPGDGPGVFSEESTNATMQGIRGRYPALRFIRLVDPGQDELALRALTAGALTALAKPSRSANPSALRGRTSSGSPRRSWPACSRPARLPGGCSSGISGSVSRGWAA